MTRPRKPKRILAAAKIGSDGSDVRDEPLTDAERIAIGLATTHLGTKVAAVRGWAFTDSEGDVELTDVYHKHVFYALDSTGYLHPVRILRESDYRRVMKALKAAVAMRDVHVKCSIACPTCSAHRDALDKALAGIGL